MPPLFAYWLISGTWLATIVALGVVAHQRDTLRGDLDTARAERDTWRRIADQRATARREDPDA